MQPLLEPVQLLPNLLASPAGPLLTQSHPAPRPLTPWQMGVMILAVTAMLVFMHFPMWGGMLSRGNPSVTEEEYYRCDGLFLACH